MTSPSLTIPSPTFPSRTFPSRTFPSEVECAPAPHPFRLRRVLQLLRTLDATPERTDVALAVFDAVGGDGGERTFQRFIRSEQGRRLLRRGNRLVAHLGDRKTLAAMPPGSLGRAYYEFATRNDLAGDGLVTLNRNVDREVPELDPVRRWFWDRFTAMHDLWHVVTGCDTSPEQECLLLAFSQGQAPQRGFRALLALAVLRSNVHLTQQWKLARAWRCGRRARPLILEDWEELLPLSLEHLRRRLGVRLLPA